MKILGVDESIKRTVTCANCASIIEFFNADVVEDKRTDYRGDWDYFYYIECPNCKYHIPVKQFGKGQE